RSVLPPLCRQLADWLTMRITAPQWPAWPSRFFCRPKWKPWGCHRKVVHKIAGRCGTGVGTWRPGKVDTFLEVIPATTSSVQDGKTPVMFSGALLRMFVKFIFGRVSLLYRRNPRLTLRVFLMSQNSRGKCAVILLDSRI